MERHAFEHSLGPGLPAQAPFGVENSRSVLATFSCPPCVTLRRPPTPKRGSPAVKTDLAPGPYFRRGRPEGLLLDKVVCIRVFGW